MGMCVCVWGGGGKGDGRARDGVTGKGARGGKWQLGGGFRNARGRVCSGDGGRQGRGGMQSAWVGCEDWMVEEERRGMDLRVLVVTRCSTRTHGHKAQWPEQLTADQHVPGSDHLWIGMLALQKTKNIILLQGRSGEGGGGEERDVGGWGKRGMRLDERWWGWGGRGRVCVGGRGGVGGGWWWWWGW